MYTYLLGRLLWMIPMLLGITLISFLVIQLAPGEPVSLGQAMDPNVSAASLEKLRHFYHLDQPLLTQYWLWLKQIAVLDFGHSFNPDGRLVLDDHQCNAAL